MYHVTMMDSCYAQYLKDTSKCDGGPGKHDVLVVVRVKLKASAQTRSPCYRLGLMAAVVQGAHAKGGRQKGYTVGPHSKTYWNATKTFGFNTPRLAAAFVRAVRKGPSYVSTSQDNLRTEL